MREPDDEVRAHDDPLSLGLENRGGDAGELDLLLDPPQRFRRPALRRVHEVVAAGLLEEAQRLVVERLAARPGRKRPLQIDPAGQQLVRELDRPALLRDRREVVELEARDRVPRPVVLDLGDHVVGVAQPVERCPHLRAGAEGALIRTAPRDEQRHVAFGGDAVRLARCPELFEVPLLPVGPRDPVHLANPLRVVVRPEPTVAVQVGDAVHGGEITPLAKALEQLVEDVLALATHADVERRAVAQAVLGQRRDVLAAGDDHRLRELAARRGHQLSLDGPLTREHRGEADDIGVARYASQHVLDGQPLADVAGMRRERPVATEPLADGVDDRRRVSVRARVRGHVREADTRSRKRGRFHTRLPPFSRYHLLRTHRTARGKAAGAQHQNALRGLRSAIDADKNARATQCLFLFGR